MPTLEGKIQFKNVSFQYPTRPSVGFKCLKWICVSWEDSIVFLKLDIMNAKPRHLLQGKTLINEVNFADTSAEEGELMYPTW